jgi:hypothetical protein
MKWFQAVVGQGLGYIAKSSGKFGPFRSFRLAPPLYVYSKAFRGKAIYIIKESTFDGL